MTGILLIIALIILLCVVLNRITDKVGIPILLAFILLGMAFGTDGIWKIEFDNFHIAEQTCTVALIFIMFYGGFGTNWEQAKPVAWQAGILSTLGVALTAGATGVFCHLILRMDWMESLLLGSVVSSTDAASVFSILRSKKLGLKHNTASLLELESGSNDPSSYMLTMIVLTLMAGGMTAGSMVSMIVMQFACAILVSVVVSFAALWMLRHFRFAADGFDTILVIAVAIVAYALAAQIGGNGYLSVYIVGIILGNSKFQHKEGLVPFFDGITGLMQILVFFLLGLLSYPSRIGEVIGTAVWISLFLIFVARPIVIFLLMIPFRGRVNQMLLVSFTGLRGAASIVFAIMATVSGVALEEDLFHIVFGIVLISIAFQGTLIPWVAKRLDMIDQDLDIRKTFTDYVDEVPVQFIELRVGENHPWNGKTIAQLGLVKELLIVVIIRGSESLIPTGSTLLQAGDRVVMSGLAYQDDHGVRLSEKTIGKKHAWIGKQLSECYGSSDDLVVLIRRGSETLIPRGDTVLKQGDVLVLHATHA